MPLLPPAMQIKLIPYNPSLHGQYPEIPDKTLQPLANSFAQVMYLEWLMYEADLRKIEYKLSMHCDDEDIWEYATRHSTKLPRFKMYKVDDVQGLMAVKERQSKIAAEISQPAIELFTTALQLASWQEARRFDSVGTILKYAWARTNKAHLKTLLPRFPVHFTWDWL